ncbi:SDR family oxidoreductase [Amycolatopsis sp. NPDC051061]|uniref:SDR family oxidoreductase n=1 Tax=Amycolatopsis sp. NPDC051061 TaxID=3155042 RepID=UPI0034122603
MTQQQTVFVTGASAGFGAAIARRFVAEGARVIAVARSADKLEKLAGELGNAVLPVPLDVSDPEAVKEKITTLPDGWQEVDVLVNNAGLAKGLEPAHKADLQDWEDMIATNVRGLTHVTRALLPGMVERGRGHVINIGSIAGTYPYPGGNVYGATKAFVHQFSLNLRSDLHGTGVRVTNVEPGMVGGTDFSKVRFDGDQDKADKVYQGTTPLTADDVAESVFWAANQPKHVNINVIELMPVVQSFSALQIYRES